MVVEVVKRGLLMWHGQAFHIRREAEEVRSDVSYRQDAH